MDSATGGDLRKYVIVGNGFAGTTAAEQLRKHDPACEITLFGDEPYTLYNRISLPPMLRKQIPEAKVMIRNLAWHEEHRIALHQSLQFFERSMARCHRARRSVRSAASIFGSNRTSSFRFALSSFALPQNPVASPAR